MNKNKKKEEAYRFLIDKVGKVLLDRIIEDEVPRSCLAAAERIVDGCNVPEMARFMDDYKRLLQSCEVYHRQGAFYLVFVICFEAWKKPKKWTKRMVGIVSDASIAVNLGENEGQENSREIVDRKWRSELLDELSTILGTGLISPP